MRGSGVVVQTLRFVHGTDGTVGTTTWVQLDDSLNSNVMIIDIFDSSGQVLELGQGPAGSETRVCFVFPGGNGRIPLILDQGQRLTVRAVDGVAASGQLCMNLYG